MLLNIEFLLRSSDCRQHGFIFLQIAIAGFYDDDGSNVDPAPPPAPEPAAKPPAQPPTGAPKQSATSR